MAENITLAGLVVDLLLNTASFEAGSTKAQRIANKAAKDIDREFRSVQGALSGIFARLGPVGEAAATALDQVGSAASAAMSKLGGLGSGIGTLGAVTAGLATALASVATAVTAAMIGIAVHTAESAAKMEDLAHSTGISVEALSKLQTVGHMIAPDVSIDDIAKSLGRMNRQIVEAASASTTTITPFQRLGISIRDASGQVKSGEQIFAEIGDKFSQMQDGAVKSGLAMMIFGRSGASIIPILDEGGAKLEHIIQLGQRFGAIINTETAEAAHQFKENLAELDLVMQGIENRIMQAFLPALQSLTKALDQMAEGTSYTNQEILNATEGFGQFQIKAASLDSILQDAIGIVKLWIPILADMATTAIVAANDVSELISVMGILADHQRELAAHPFKFWFGTGGTPEMEGQIKAVDDAVNKANNDAIDLAAHLYNAVNQKAEPKTGFDLLDETKKRLSEFDKLHAKSGINLQSNAARQAELTIISQIQKLQAQAAAEGMLAQAISGVSSATIEATAHAEALRTVAEMNAVAGKYGVSVTKQQAAAIEQATLRLEAYKDALKVNKDLQENIDKTKLAAEGTLDLAKAYQQGGAAIETAQEKLKLSTLADAVNDLQELHDKLGKLPLSGKSAELFNTLGTSLDQAKAKLAAATVEEHAQALADAALASAKLGDNLKFETAELQKQIAATLEGTDALRAFSAQKQIDVFVQEHPGVLSPEQIAGLRQQAAALSSGEEELQAVQKFRSENNVKAIGDEIAELTKYHDTVVKDSTDELVYQAKMHDLLLSQQRAWDELLLKTNDTGAGMRVFFDEMAFDGQTAAERIHDSLTSTFSSLEDTFARFVSGQKVSWKELESQIVSTLAKQSADVLLRGGITSIRGAIIGKLPGQQEAMNEKIPGIGPVGIGSTIAQMFGIGIGGKTAAPGSSPSNPIYTKSVDTAAGLKAPASGLTELALSKAPSGIGSLLSDLSTVLPFGGFMAEGGDVTPGRAYIVGEKRAELFMPGRSGRIIPQIPAMGESSYPSLGAPVFNFHGVTDGDTFKRSQSQMAGWYQRSLYSARNG